MYQVKKDILSGMWMVFSEEHGLYDMWDIKDLAIRTCKRLNDILKGEVSDV